MNKDTYRRLVKRAARAMLEGGNRATVANVARWSEGARQTEIQQFSDTRFSRFAADVDREVAAQIREDADTAAALR